MGIVPSSLNVGILRRLLKCFLEHGAAKRLRYKGMGGESGGIIGMLEVIESDFARLEVRRRPFHGTRNSDCAALGAVTRRRA